MENEHQTTRILNRILKLMPAPRHWNTDEEARVMRWQMDKIVEEELSKDQKQPPLDY